MANEVYLRPDAGDGTNGVRLRPVSLGGDSDSWWAGAQRCFMAIPIAATLATVALSASLCWGAQQRNEEIIPPTALAVEEWTKPLSITRPVQLSGPVWDDQVPAGALFGQPEDYPWTVYSPPYATPKFLYLPDPEELPAGSLFGVPEQDGWAPARVSRPVTPQPLLWVDEEIVPQAAGFTPEEAYQPVLLAQPQASWRKLWVGNESVVVPSTPDESYWAVSTPAYPTPKFLYLPDPEHLPAGSLFGVPEQSEWLSPWVIPPVKAVLPLWVDEEIIPQAVALSPDEDAWPLPTPRPQPVQVQVWSVTDEIMPQPASLSPEEDPWTLAVVQPQATWRKLWVGNESVVQPQVPLEESAWTPPLVRPVTQTQVWWGDDEIIPQAVALTHEDDAWVTPQILTRLPVQTIWLGEDETVQPPANFFLEDDSWFPTVKYIPNTVPLTLIAITTDNDTVTQAAPAGTVRYIVVRGNHVTGYDDYEESWFA